MCNHFEILDLVEINCPLCDCHYYRKERLIFGYPVQRPWQLVKCKECGFIYVNPRLSERDTLKGYSGRASFSREFGATSYIIDAEGLKRQIIKKTPYFDRTWRNIVNQGIIGGRLLDVGCGSGAFLKYAFAKGFDVYGQDVAQKAPIDDQDLNFPIFIGELSDAPWPEGYFDVIVNRAVLEHLWDPLKELLVIGRLLKPGGILACVEIPNYRSLSILLNRSSFFVNHPPGHLNYFTPYTLRKFAERWGFQVLALKSHGLDIVEILGGNKRIIEYGEGASTEMQHVRGNQRKSKFKSNNSLDVKNIKASDKSRALNRVAKKYKGVKKVMKRIVSLFGVGGILEMYCNKKENP